MNHLLSKYTIPKSYHNFSDKRNFIGIPNAMNVFSNILFLYPAFYLLFKKKANFLAINIIFLAFTSAYYHINPSNRTILLDMIFVISINTIILSYFVDERIGYILYGLGILSVCVWKVTEDIKFYALLQIGILLFCLYKLADTSASHYILPILCLAIAVRASERYDSTIYKFTNKLVSGHTLKHIIAPIQIYVIIVVLEKIGKI